MKPKASARRLEKLGVTEFETAAEVRRQQLDVRRRLRRTTAKPLRYAGLKNCDALSCGRAHCSEVCAFGARRRRLQQIPAAYRLLKKSADPLFEVRVSRAAWSRAEGELKSLRVGAVRQLNRRCLDRVYKTDVIAVGSLSVSVDPERQGRPWRAEIHQIVAGATRKDLERSYSTRKPNLDDFVRVEKVKNLGETVSRVLRPDLRVWQHPGISSDPASPKKKARAEYYLWLLGLARGARTLRYGCDRHLNKLTKKPRTIRPKLRKARRTPVWLEPYQFGSAERENWDSEKLKSQAAEEAPKIVD